MFLRCLPSSFSTTMCLLISGGKTYLHMLFSFAYEKTILYLFKFNTVYEGKRNHNFNFQWFLMWPFVSAIKKKKGVLNFKDENGPYVSTAKIWELERIAPYEYDSHTPVLTRSLRPEVRLEVFLLVCQSDQIIKMKGVRKNEWERRREVEHGHLKSCSMERLSFVAISPSKC